MIIDTLTNTNVYVEKKNLITITVNKLKNNNGVINIDDLQNPLISLIDSGDTSLYRLKTYNGVDNIMLYNSTNKDISFVRSGELINIDIDFSKGLRYFIGAKRISATEHTENVFNVELNGLNVFKIYLDNGVELTNYTIKGNSVTINGLEKSYINDFSEITLFVYKDNKITDTTEFVIEYYNYPTIYDATEFISEDYFGNDFLGISLEYFDRLAVNESVDKEIIRGNFKFSDKSIIKKINNNIELETFDSNEDVDFVQYVGNSEFRFILVNPVFGRIFIINNCYMDNGVPIVFQKEKNIKRCNISCGNYIDIKIMGQSAYGLKKYGKGLYGSETWVNNSCRKGE